MRIGQLATRVGVSTDTVRFYERSGWLPRPARRDNDYREYGEADAEHLRLLIDLRRLDVPLDDAARIAAWCHSGHCAETDAALPALIAGRRTAIGERIEGLRALDARLAELERHLGRGRRSLAVVGSTAAGACCDAAGAIVDSAEGAAVGVRLLRHRWPGVRHRLIDSSLRPRSAVTSLRSTDPPAHRRPRPPLGCLGAIPAHERINGRTPRRCSPPCARPMQPELRHRTRRAAARPSGSDHPAEAGRVQ